MRPLFASDAAERRSASHIAGAAGRGAAAAVAGGLHTPGLVAHGGSGALLRRKVGLLHVTCIQRAVYMLVCTACMDSLA